MTGEAVLRGGFLFSPVDDDATAFAGGCRTKPFRNRRCTLAEVGAREAEHDDIAPIGQRATEAVAVFGPHPYNGSSELVGGLCDSLRARQHSRLTRVLRMGSSGLSDRRSRCAADRRAAACQACGGR